jgi:DNA segregation ATPase FtsK/SpoIIIE, S-DNA-T family
VKLTKAPVRVGGRRAPFPRGLLVRQRMYVPLWVTMLEGATSLVWRLLSGMVRLVVAYPVPSLASLVTLIVQRRAGWWGVVVLAGVAVAVGVAWSWLAPASWERRALMPLRSWWRYQRTYRWRWRRLMDGCGLLEMRDGDEVMPQIAELYAGPSRDDLLVTLAPGQIPGDVAASAEGLAHGLGAFRVLTQIAEPGLVIVTVLWDDPLSEVISVDLVDEPDPSADDGARAITARQVMARLTAVRVGEMETGGQWALCMLPGRHMLISGATGAGKSSLLWGGLWELRDLIRAGWISVVALDPKFMELRALATSGLGRVITRVPTMADELDALVQEMDERCEEIEGRVHMVSATSPIRIVIVDELATLTALAPDNKTKGRIETAMGHLLSRGRAAGYLVIITTVEPTKEVVRWRGLCPTRVCFRTDDDQADLALGDGAHDAGAHTELISEDTPGIGFIRVQGRSGVARVRAIHVTDEDIAGLQPAGLHVVLPVDDDDPTPPTPTEKITKTPAAAEAFNRRRAS